jgi:hypothetical protein
MQTLTAANMPVAIENDNVVVRAVEVGDLTAGLFRLAKGTDLGPALVGLEGDMCQCPHWGYMISGRLLMHTADGDQIYEAGQAFYWAAGHVPVALEDCEYIDFSPTKELATVVAHLTGGAA